MTGYDPHSFRARTWLDATHRFSTGDDSPRDYLERCVEAIEAREGVVQAFAALNIEGARAAADASTARWQAGNAHSLIDGMPVGIKDLLETRDMPTELGCKAYAGHFPKRDNAAVWALREAGAVILGKTVTAELGGSEPGPTTNPFDPQRTPGGSSSGSAAAVAAGMLPAAIGTQVGGSIIRPAAFCGNYALKPSQGAINRGERLATSMSTHGVHAGGLEDMWQVAIEIASRVGGDRGYPGLRGPDRLPSAVKPERLVVLESEGWSELDEATRSAFEGFVTEVAAQGVTIIRRGDHGLVEALEHALRGARRIAGRITIWENRWAQRNLVNEHPDGVSDRTKAGLALAEKMTPADYRALLAERSLAQDIHRAAASIADAVLMLSCPGPAPVWKPDAPNQPPSRNPTGDFVFNAPSSLLFAPAVNVPKLAVDGMPVGVQLVGLPGEDAETAGLARWLDGAVGAVSG